MTKRESSISTNPFKFIHKLSSFSVAGERVSVREKLGLGQERGQSVTDAGPAPEQQGSGGEGRSSVYYHKELETWQ